MYGLKSDERLKRSENILEVCMRLGGKEKNHFIDTPQKLHFAGWLLPKKPDEYSLDSIPSIRRNKTIYKAFPYEEYRMATPKGVEAYWRGEWQTQGS